MKKLYGSLNNRVEEGKMLCEKIEVGTGVTQYGYTDRNPYEVVEVANQKHIFIRAVESKRIDDNGASDCQEYQFISNPNNPRIELVLKNNVWFQVKKYSKEILLERTKNFEDMFTTKEVAYNYLKVMSNLTKKQLENIELGKIVKKYSKMNISIGTMQRYFDYSF